MVLLLDNSFSMRFGNRFEKARTRALDIVNNCSDRDTVQIVLFSDTTEVLNAPQTEHDTLRALLRQLQPGYRKTEYASALKLANELLSSVPNQDREIHWISDFQASGWSLGNEEPAIGENIRIQIDDVSDSESGNTAVSQAQINQFMSEETQAAKVLTKVSSFGLKAPATATLVLELNGKKLQEKTLSLDTNDFKLVEFENFSVPPGTSAGKIKLEFTDPLPADNVYYFTLNSQRKARLLLLGGKSSRDNFYLSKALSASKDSPFLVEVQDLSPISAFDSSRFAGVVLNNLETVPAKLATLLEEFVSLGGGLVTAPGNRANPIEWNLRLEKLLPAKLTAKDISGGNKVSYIGEIQKQHPIFQGFQPVHYSYFMTTPFSGYFQAKPLDNAHVLLKLEDGNPLLLEKTIGKGRSLLFASSLNMDWNDLPLKSVFLPFVQQLVQYSINYQSGQNSFTVGEVIPFDKLNPMLRKALNKIPSASSSFRQSWKVLKPSGEKTELNDGDLLKAPFFTLEEPGIYQTRVHNLDNPLAVNVSPLESDLRKTDVQRMIASFKRIPDPSSKDQSKPSADQKQSLESRQKIWWYLLILALIFLAVESYVSNRYYKKVPEI